MNVVSIHNINDLALMACLVVFHDASFDSDSVKINADKIFKLTSPNIEVRAI